MGKNQMVNGFSTNAKTIRLSKVNKMPTRSVKGRLTFEWEPLSRGFLKFNVDGTVKGSQGQVAIGGVLKDEKGVVKMMFSIAIGISEANIAEEMTNKEAFKLFEASKWVGSHLLIVESDLNNAIN